MNCKLCGKDMKFVLTNEDGQHQYGCQCGMTAYLTGNKIDWWRNGVDWSKYKGSIPRLK